MSDRFDLRQLRYFVAVAEELNFRRAAERLHISQPPLSRAIAALEDALGVALFTRSTVRVALTPAGAAALAESIKVLGAADALAARMRSHEPEGSRALRVGVTPAVPPGMAGRLESLWRERLAPRRVAVSSGASPELLRELRDGRLDFALVGLPVPSPADYAQIVVGAEPLVAALPAAHAAARKRKLNLADLTGLPIFWWPRTTNPAYFDLIRRHFASRQFRPRFVAVEPAQTTTLERIAQGEGFTLVNRGRAGIRMRGLAYRPLLDAEPIAIRLALLWRPAPDESARQREQDARQLAGAARQVLPAVPAVRHSEA